jgi:signal transduction histidine kinase
MDSHPIETVNVLASIAHDLRSPLNAVIGFSKLMLKGIDGPLSDMQSSDVDAIHTNGNTMLQMVDGLIDLARIEAGWYQPGKDEVPLHPILERVISLAMPVAESKQVELSYKMSDVAVTFAADPAHIQKSMERLVLASIDLVESGTLEVTIDAGAEENSMCIKGNNPGGLYAARHSLDAFQGGGAEDAARMDAPALQLIVAGQTLGLYGCTLTAEAISEFQFRVLVRCPRGA